MDNLFIAATRSKFRFVSPIGPISTEDLWDLPLTSERRANLDDIAKELYKQLKEANQEQSFVQPVAAPTNEIEVKLELVKFIIKTKMEERDAAKAAEEKRANKQRLSEIIAEKEDQALAGKSVEELKALRATM